MLSKRGASQRHISIKLHHLLGGSFVPATTSFCPWDGEALVPSPSQGRRKRGQVGHAIEQGSPEKLAKVQ